MYFIAEMSSNHNQDIKTAMRIVKEAKTAGADAIKVQVYTPECLTINTPHDDFIIKDGVWKGRTYYEIYEKAMMPWNFVKPLMEYAKELKLDFIATPYSYKALAFLKELKVQNYKVASFESNWTEFTKDVILQSKLFQGTCYVSRNNKDANVYIDMNVVNLWAISNYPSNGYTRPNYNKSPYIGRWGLSCHALSAIPSILATYDNASVIEKHIRLEDIDPRGYAFDASFSFTPDQFRKLIEVVKQTEQTIKNGLTYKPEPHSRSVRVIQDVKAGDVLTKENLGIIRPSGLVQPDEYTDYLGCIVDKDYEAGDEI